MTPRAVARQVPGFMEFSQARILEWILGLPFPSPGDLPDPGTEPESPVSPASLALAG